MGQPIVHFEIIGKDPKRLRSYYGDLFGWEFDTNAPVAGFFRRVLICLWHKTRPLGQIATAKNSPIKCNGIQAPQTFCLTALFLIFGVF